MKWTIYLAIIFLASLIQDKNQVDEIFISGKTDIDVEFLTVGNDTIKVVDGMFSDTLYREEDQYNYLKISSWQWSRIVYLESGQPLNIDFRDEWVNTDGDKFNEYLLNRDSILIPYTAKWDMADSTYRKAWRNEFPENMQRINRFFEGSNVSQSLIDEIEQMEYMKRGHLTANFISFQEKKGLKIDRNIYSFVDGMDLNNERLGFHVNNRNFQYYYYIDKVSDEVPDSIYPFAIVDTVNKYVAIKDIKNMIIANAVKSGLYDESVNHDALFDLYEENIGKLNSDDKIVRIYDQIQKLKSGNSAPDFGELTNVEGDKITIENLKGKHILLSAWGTWCPYCKEELPHLKELMTQYSDKIDNVAISLDKEAEKWQNYILENDWQAIHLHDPDRKSTFKENYLISGTNIYYLIDKNGMIISSGLKPSDEKLKSLIQELD